MGKHLKFASVVVDVPSRGTDRPFDYEIPEELADQVEVGCRVHVPFGSRIVQGYVVSLRPQPEVANVRPIREVIDLLPPLNEELVKLAEWMSKYYFSTRLAALEVMIPSALRARYDKILIPGSNVVEEGAYLLGEAERQLMEAVQRARTRIVAQEGRSDRRCDAFPHPQTDQRETVGRGGACTGQGGAKEGDVGKTG